MTRGGTIVAQLMHGGRIGHPSIAGLHPVAPSAVRAAGAFLVEDDAMRELAFAPERLPPPLAAEDPDGHVVHIGSLTKVAAPGLRIGAIAGCR